jgi:hypothetical protein
LPPVQLDRSSNCVVVSRTCACGMRTGRNSTGPVNCRVFIETTNHKTCTPPPPVLHLPREPNEDSLQSQSYIIHCCPTLCCNPHPRALGARINDNTQQPIGHMHQQATRCSLPIMHHRRLPIMHHPRVRRGGRNGGGYVRWLCSAHSAVPSLGTRKRPIIWRQVRLLPCSVCLQIEAHRQETRHSPQTDLTFILS